MSMIINISYPSHLLLERLATFGIYGKDAQEVATRFVDERLQQMFDQSKPFNSTMGSTIDILEAQAKADAPRAAVIEQDDSVPGKQKVDRRAKSETRRRRNV